MCRVALQSILSHYLFIIFFGFYNHAIGKNLGTLPNDIDISKSPNGWSSGTRKDIVNSPYSLVVTK